jgi:uncharacterized membrane protein YhhN
MIPALLTLAAAVSGALHVRAAYRGPRAQVYVFKPLTVTCLLALALLAEPESARYQAAIAIGLACSIAGDVFLMLPGDRFLPGVASFLLAHIAYLVAFTTGVPLGASPILLLPWALVGGLTLAVLWRHLGPMQAPVAVYVAVIVAMAWQAMTRMAVVGSTGSVLAALGAALFVASDAALALNRFRKPFRGAAIVVHAAYYAAQALIAWSV